MQSLPIRIMHISDTHLFSNPDHTLLGVNTQHSLEAVLEQILDAPLSALKRTKLILISGDLSHDGSVNSYLRLAKTCEALHFPVYYVPGNHDNTSTLAHIHPFLPIVQAKQILLEEWQIILLSSQQPGLVKGYLQDSELAILISYLEDYSTQSAIVVLHHQPVTLGSHWIDQLGLVNAAAFWEILSHYPQIKMVLFGHIHQEHSQLVHNIHCYSAPATSVQFLPNVPQFALDPLPQGYRWINLYSNGQFETGVQRLTQYIGIFDQSATGY